MKKSKKKILFKILLSFIISIFILLLLFFALNKMVIRENLKGKVKQNVTIEYGKMISLSDILQTEDIENIEVSPALETLTEVGEYSLKVKINNEIFETNLSIKDTTAPNLEVIDITKYIDEDLPTVNDFVTFSSDLSNYELLPIELTKSLGEQEIVITAIDQYGNKTEKKAKLTLIEDKEPPIFAGLTPISIVEGTKIDLRNGVSAVDAQYGDVEFTVDDSSVSYYTPGNYTITYYAKDPLGNETYNTRKITITPKPIIYMIQNFPVYNQYPNYPNGCESIALYNLLRYYNINVTPEEIVEKLKKGDGPYWLEDTLYGGNPEIEFVGDPRDIHGYGVYQKPILEVANTFKPGMIDYTGHSLNEVLELVKNEIPVQVWVSINLRDTSICTHWIYSPTGETINWICDLHSVVIVGYTNTSVFVSDSYTGTIEEYNRSQFEKMYNLFGKRALYYPN